jgi:UDP-N-acetylmuramate dehydrogenase
LRYRCRVITIALFAIIGITMRTLTNLSAVQYSSFRFETQLSSLIECESIADLQALESGMAPVVLGEGSNTIFMQDLAIPLCRYVASAKHITKLTEQHVLVHVEAGHNWHQLVEWSVQNEFWGIENLALIPGSVGAAPVQNIGAYGVELADVCLYVDFYHWQHKTVQRIAAGRCQFGYRDSVFKQLLAGKGIIVAVGLCLKRHGSPVLGYKGLDHLPANVDIDTIYHQVIAVRRSKLPDPATLPNCGSFFKNPILQSAHYLRLKNQFPAIPGFKQSEDSVKVPAAWLIEQQGFKGKCEGDVGCYSLQPLVLVNHGKGTPAQLLVLISAIQRQVFAAYSVQLEPEVRMLNNSGLLHD